MRLSNTYGLSVLALAALIAGGCSSGTKSPGSAANASAAYPDWAAAVVPDYPNVNYASSVTASLYQLDTVDDTPTVLAWYKAHVPGTWTTNDPSQPRDWHNTARGVSIQIEVNTYPGNDAAARKPKTLIAISRKQ